MGYSSPKRGPNGNLELKLGLEAGFHNLVVFGGPFDNWKKQSTDDFGVCVRAERVPKNADVRLAIHDFQVPKDEKEVEEALRQTLAAMLDGKRVWVGCMGGWGRTGLFLSLLAKAVGIKDPVAYVREHYSRRAVETQEQQDYVDKFDVSGIRTWLMFRGWTRRWIKTVFWWNEPL
jgi:protein-tyrosine phosphatase